MEEEYKVLKAFSILLNFSQSEWSDLVIDSTTVHEIMFRIENDSKNDTLECLVCYTRQKDLRFSGITVESNEEFDYIGDLAGFNEYFLAEFL